MKYLLAILILACALPADARGRRRGYYESSSSAPAVAANIPIRCMDGLPLVNWFRERLGLKPFKFDPKLQVNATAQAIRMARGGFVGHDGCQLGDVSSNGAEGVGGATAGEPGTWQSCCWQDSWTYAAATYIDVGEYRYCAIHVRN